MDVVRLRRARRSGVTKSRSLRGSMGDARGFFGHADEAVCCASLTPSARSAPRRARSKEFGVLCSEPATAAPGRGARCFE